MYTIKSNKLCTMKTTVMALGVSFFGALGLTCFLIWYSIAAFGEMSRYPFAYPGSVAGGLLSFLLFIASIVLYLKFRKDNGKWIGVLLDVTISIFALPAFGFILSQALHLF